MISQQDSTDFYDSSDDDDTNNGVNLNHAMRMSFTARMSETRKSTTTRSVSITGAQNSRSKYGFCTCSVRRCSTEKSTSISFNSRDNKTRSLSDKDDQGCGVSEQNRKETPSLAVKTELKVKDDKQGNKPRIIDIEILLEPVRIVSQKNETDNLSTNINLNESTANNLDQSNIWPALCALETSLNKSDVNTSKDYREIMEKLNEQFHYSPRSFTETLLTLIEESFVEPEEISSEFLERSKNAEGVKLLENESSSGLIVSRSNDESTDDSCSTNFHASENTTDHSTKFMNLKRQATPAKLVHKKIQNKIYRQAANLDLNKEAPEEIIAHRLREVSPASSSSENKTYRKTPGLIRNRDASKISMTHRLRVGSASSVDRSPRMVDKTVTGTPKIVVKPATPESSVNYRMRRQTPLKSCEDDEYLTAESDTEEPEECTIELGEPGASSSEKLDMSRVAFHHQEWLDAYAKVSEYKPVSCRNKSMIAERKRRISTHVNKIEKRWLQELKQKRQKCFDLVDQLLENEGKAASAVEEKSACFCNPCEQSMEFFNVLCACTEYYAYGMNARENFQSRTKDCRFVSSLSINLKKRQNQSPHVSVYHGRIKSPRKSLVTKTLRVKPTGARSPSPHSKGSPMPLKRRSLKAVNSPSIDRSSIRPVAKLRRMFSPGQRAEDGRKFNARLKNGTPKSFQQFRSPETRKSPEGARFKITEREQQKYSHIESRVAKYIRGEIDT